MGAIPSGNLSSPNYTLIFGGGRVGLQAVQDRSSTESCIVIDSDINCQVAKHLVIHTEITQKEELLQIVHTKQSYLILGGIDKIVHLFSLLLPSYVIPAAPVHMIAHYCKYYLHQNYKAIKFSHISLSSLLLNELTQYKPKELFLYPSTDDFYLSYAAWEEKCADTCPGFPDYCVQHQRCKPITVTSFTQNIFHRMQSQFWGYVLESQQINPGIGGILGADLVQFFHDFQLKLASLPSGKTVNVLLATTCNCHGVISGFTIERIL